MTQESPQQFFAAIIDNNDSQEHYLSPIFGVGLTAVEALADAEGEKPGELRNIPYRDFSIYPCSAALYDRVTDIGGDVVWVKKDGRLVLPGE